MVNAADLDSLLYGQASLMSSELDKTTDLFLVI